MKLIKHAMLLEKDNTYRKMDVAYDASGICAIEEHLDIEAQEVLDADGLVLLPGLIDVHVHLREPGYEHKETIQTGTMAAAHGGFTTIMAMPNVIPYPDNVETMKQYLEKIKQDSVVHVIPYGTLTKGEKSKELSDIKGMSQLGIHAYSDDGVGVAKEDIMKEAMEVCKKEDAMIVAHTEDMSYRKPTACMHEGIRNKELGFVGIPSACEYAQMLRDLKLAKETGVKYHVCHMSAKESVQYLKEYKEAGVDCSGEVTAHHLLLNEMDVYDPNHKMNPPLRGKDDQEALIEGLLDGTIDMIANDHAPHSEAEKAKGMVEAPFGIVSLETAFPLLYTRFVKDEKRFTMQQLIHFMSEAPAKRFGFTNKGKLAVGHASDMILVDLNTPRVIDKNKFFSKGKNTPFDGWECYGNVVTTIVDGSIVYKEERK